MHRQYTKQEQSLHLYVSPFSSAVTTEKVTGSCTSNPCILNITGQSQTSVFKNPVPYKASQDTQDVP